MSTDLRERVLRNWPIKVTALALSAMLWAAVAAQEPATQLVPVRLSIEPPPGRALTQPPPEVQALFTGTAREIFKLYSDPPVVKKVIPETRASRVAVEISPQEIKLTTDAAVTVQDIQPRQFELYLDSIDIRSVPVEVRVVVRPEDGFALMGSVRAVPETVSVVGPVTLTRDVASVPTVADTIRGVRQPINRPVRLDTTGLRVVAPQVREVNIVANIMEIVTRVLANVPVTVAGEDWTVDSPTVLVTVEGPSARVGLLTADSVVVTARPMGSSDTLKVRLAVRPPPGITAWATPDSVTATRGSGV
jgi:hypothetical protein